MAGNNDADRVTVICHTNCTYSLGIAQSSRNVLISTHFAVRNFLQFVPNTYLIVSAFYIQGKVEAGTFLSKIFLQLLTSFCQVFIFTCIKGSYFFVSKGNFHNAFVTSANTQIANRSFHQAGSDVFKAFFHNCFYFLSHFLKFCHRSFFQPFHYQGSSVFTHSFISSSLGMHAI